MNYQLKSKKKKLAIFGTSGFAYETADIAIALGYDDIILLTNTVNAVNCSRFKIISDNESESLHKLGFSFAIGIGEPNIRKKIYQKFSNYSYPNLIHPRASFGHLQRESLESSIGNIITSGVVFTNNIKIGNFNIFNLNSTIGHDCIIGSFISVMPSVNISGNVEVLDGAFIGVGAIILQGTQDKKITVGKSAVIGAASLVTKSVNEYTTVIGIPANQLPPSKINSTSTKP